MSLVCLLSLGCACGADTSQVDATDLPPMSRIDDVTGDFDALSIVRRQGRFPKTVSFEDRELVLNGSGLCEWGIFGIDLYYAALYVERHPADAREALRAEQTMVIHLEFVRELTAAQLREAYSASVKINTGDDFETHRGALQELVATMQTVRPGDSYSFVAQPDLGLVVRRNNRDLATIRNEPFRKLFVALYLGDKPPTEALRAALLRGGE